MSKMALLKLTLVAVMVTLTLSAPVVDKKSNQDQLLRFLRNLVEGTSHSLSYVNYPLEFNFDQSNGLPMAYCRIQEGDLDIVRELFAAPFHQIVKGECMYCGRCTFEPATAGMSCTRISASACKTL